MENNYNYKVIRGVVYANDSIDRLAPFSKLSCSYKEAEDFVKNASNTDGINMFYYDIVTIRP